MFEHTNNFRKDNPLSKKIDYNFLKFSREPLRQSLNFCQGSSQILLTEKLESSLLKKPSKKLLIQKNYF